MQALAKVVDDSADRARPLDPLADPERPLIHQREADDRGEEAGRVQTEGKRDAEGADGESGDGRTDDPGGVEQRGIERDGGRDVLAADHLDAERLADGHIDRVRHAEQEGQREDHPDLDDVGVDERGQDPGEDHHAGLGPDENAALRQRIGEDAREQPEDHDRDELGGGDDPEPDRIVRQLQDEPRLRDLLHPGARRATRPGR